MKSFLLQFFTWWHRATLGTAFFTWRKGIAVGEDEFGNRYYRERNGSRRWVIYNGPIEATTIPPGWYGWLRGVYDLAPVDENYAARAWQLPHKPNLTGTPGAYRPRGSILKPDPRPQPVEDYDAWTPG